METGSLETMEEIGMVVGNTTPTQFDCLLSTLAEKTEYVEIQHEKCGVVLAQIDNVEIRTRGEAKELEEFGGEYKAIAKIKIVGYRDERNLLQIPHTPIMPGTPVFRAQETTIREVLGLGRETKTGAYVGLLRGHDIEVYLDINEMVQKHISVLAKTGGGKSYLVGVLLEEFMKHDVTCVVIDPHGEYISMREPGKLPETKRNFHVSPRGYASKIQEFSPDTKTNPTAKPLRFTLSSMDARDIIALTTIKNVRQYLTHLRKAIDTLRQTKGRYTIDEIISLLETQQEYVVGTLINELEYLKDVEIFAEVGTHVNEIVVKGKTAIINLRGTPPDIQELIVTRLCNALFELRKINKIPPLMLVVEEAHNFCPQQGQAASSKILRTIASEGRKFGLGLCIISQRPAKIDKNVLSQCNTQIILKITNPNDLKAVCSSVEGITSGTMDEIQALPIGTALITSPSLPIPVFVDIRPRETKHGGEAVKIIE
ncbi:MAG: ATP-binding protein [Thermoplasmata archaeon]